MLSTTCYAKIQEALGKAQRGGASVSPEQQGAAWPPLRLTLVSRGRVWPPGCGQSG